MPSHWNGQSADFDIEYYRVRKMIQGLTPYPMRGMPCEMDNHPGRGGRDSISWEAAGDSEMDNQLRGEIQYLEDQIQDLTPNSYQ